MTPRFKSGWGVYLGRVDELMHWPSHRLETFSRAGVLVRVRSGFERYMLFTLQPRPYGMLIRDFGGQVDAAEHPIHAAVREGLEESLAVLRPWLQLRKIGTAKVYAHHRTLYILLDLRGITPDELYARFHAAKHDLETSGKPIPPELNETHDLLCVPLTELDKTLGRERPGRYQERIWSKDLWKSLQGLVPLLH